MSQKEVAVKLGVCSRTIFRRLKKEGYKCRKDFPHRRSSYKHGLMSKKLSAKQLGINRRKLYPEKVKARERLHYYVKSGKIEKPNNCEICGTYFKEKKKIHGHHNDYNQPLKVVWCCNKCHCELEKQRDSS